MDTLCVEIRAAGFCFSHCPYSNCAAVQSHFDSAMSSRTHSTSGQSSANNRRDVQSTSSTTSGRSERGSRQPKVHDSSAFFLSLFRLGVAFMFC